MNWLSRHSGSIEALAAVVTAFVAIAALIGVKVQLDAADAVQRAQSARDSYRSHLALSVAHPEYASPSEACTLTSGPRAAAYAAFVDHLLYSAEQMLEVEPGWEATFEAALSPHASYLCNADEPIADTPHMITLLTRFRQEQCEAVSPCE